MTVTASKTTTEQLLRKYAFPITLLVVFTLVGLVVALLRSKFIYLLLFFSLGSASAIGEWVTLQFPKYKQIFRRTIQAAVGGGLFIGLSLFHNVNFQFSELFFDLYAGVITGAFIQFAFARLFLPFILGNAFCSRACWSGALFELVQPLNPKVKTPRYRNEWIAFTYISTLITISSVASYYYNPAIFETSKRWWILGENLLILGIGVFVSRYWGRRTYCRTFCPFISVSGIFSRFSIFKITPIDAQSCNSCGKCNRHCPMLVDVRAAVEQNQRISHKSCILCEHCVDACPYNCIELAPKFPWQKNGNTANQ